MMTDRWVFEILFDEGVTKEQAQAYADRVMPVSKEIGIDLDVHGEASMFSVKKDVAEKQLEDEADVDLGRS